jgi:hypothetical protein
MRKTIAMLAILQGIACKPASPPDEPVAPDAAPPGITGQVRDNAGKIVVGATVYLVPATQVPRDPMALTDVVAERESPLDEPLEDPIAQHGKDFTQAVTDIGGYYHVASVPDDQRYFVVVVPSDDLHLPGGSLCRKSLAGHELAGKQIDITISSKPSPKAQYVGPSVCLGCHGITHQRETLHMEGIRKMGGVAGLQDSRRFPDWDRPLAKFSDTGTTLFFYDFTTGARTYKVSETRPASGVSFTARLYRANGAYFVDLTDVKGGTGTVTYPVEMSYGGGLYKQTYLVVIGGSRYVLPFNFQYQGETDETQPPAHWVWAAYDAPNWYDETVPGLRTPAAKQSFDASCAGCHFTGFSLAGDATTGFRAHAVADAQGEMDFDGDGRAEELNVTCESCHGPGSEHWQHAGAGFAIVSPQLLTPEREVLICATCHTRPVGFAAGGTPAPLDETGLMMQPGISRKEFLTRFVSKLDDVVWDTDSGDGMHAKGNYQQASEFMNSTKYRNGSWLLSCASCHDPHGNNIGLKHALKLPLDDASTGPGLCLSCHDKDLQPNPDLEARMLAHYGSEGVISIPKKGVGCADCHATKTAISAAGARGRTIENVTYYGGDITSHRFDVPMISSIKTKGPEMMAIPYTGTCGYCHIQAP